MGRMNEECAERHICDASLSSISTLGWADAGSLTDDEESFTGSTTVDQWKNVRQRPRLGAEMAILACTSPEIKALKMQVMPGFPRATQHSPDLQDNTEHELDFSRTPTNVEPQREDEEPERSLSPLLAMMNDVNGSPNIPFHRSETNLNIYLDPDDDLMEGLCGGLFGKTPRFNNLSSNMSPKNIGRGNDGCKGSNNDSGFFVNKENLHPNVGPVIHAVQKTRPHTNFRSSSESKLLARDPTDERSTLFPSSAPLSISIPKPSLHRRGSCDALPTPDVISQLESPSFPMTRRDLVESHRGSTIDDTASLSTTAGTLGKGPEHYRNRTKDRRIYGMKKAFSNMSLTTGFR